MQRWHQRALECKKIGEMHLAAKYHKEKKKMIEDLQKISASKAAGFPLPEYSEQVYEHQKEIHFRKYLTENDLEVAIIGATNLKPPSGTTNADSYVIITCPMADANTLNQFKCQKVSGSNNPRLFLFHQ